MEVNPHISEQRSFYDQRWSGFTYINRPKLLRSIAILDAIASTKIIEPKILELGCGTGWFTGVLGNLGPSVGVDLSEVAIGGARERYPHVKFLPIDISEWEYPKSAFDIVVSHEVLEHVEDQEAYLDMAHGLLRSGGYLILTTPNKDAVLAYPDDAIAARDLQPIEKWLTIKQLKAMMASRFVEVSITTVIPGTGVKGAYRIIGSPITRGIMRRTGAIWLYDRFVLKLGFGLHILAIARKP
jgi:2-polyprenyl-3-methyl-5-hydroxy-6-metoxy-1,4-benzoquinol methylase